MAEKLYISKVSLGSDIYYIKDTEAQEILATLGTAAYADVSTTGVAIGDEGLVTGGQVATAIHDIAGALHFIAVLNKDAASFEAALAEYKTAHPDYEESTGDIVIYKDAEYIYADSKWNELGSEGRYVLKSTQIAGIAINDGITVAQLKTALGLGALAYKDSASGTVAAQTISGVKATGTSTGSISVVLTETDASITPSTTTVTPEGDISGTVTATGAVSLAASTTESDFQVTGTVAAPTITVTPATTTIQTINSVGTQASFTEGTFSQGTLPSYSQGSKAAWSASVDENGTLSFSFTANGDDTWDAGTLPTKAADTFVANELPTKNTAQTVATGITSASATAPVFTGGRIAATFTGNTAGDAITATFDGKDMTVMNGGTYKKSGVDTQQTKFTGAALELAVGDITVSAKDVTVS